VTGRVSLLLAIRERVGAVARRPWDLAVSTGVLAAAAVLGATGDAGDTIDTAYFLHASQTLLSGRWLETFADPGLQAGPLQIGGVGVAGRLGEAFGVSALRGVCVLQSVVLTACVLAGAALVRGPRRSPLVLAAAGAAALATGTIGSAYFYGHPAEVVSPVLWVAATRAAMLRRPASAGVLVGLSAGFETWGVLGLAVLLVDPRPRALARSAAVALAVVGATYGPFVLHGPFAMFQYHWTVAPGTLPAILGAGPSYGWPLRIVQATLAGGAGAAASRLLRRRASACWLVPMAIVWAKVCLDPGRGAWYLLAPETIAVLGAAQIAGSRRLGELVGARRRVEDPPGHASIPERAVTPRAWG
jgi:hypothetical protein